jgi:hypothetical protein
MSNDIKKLFFYGVLLVAGVTFGMQLAESGNKDTYGSPQYYVQQPQVQAQQIGQTEQTQQIGQTGQVQQGQQGQQLQAQSPLSTAPTITAPADILLPPATKPSVDKFADKTANLLQKLSKQGIDWVASLFGTVE